ncbi:uncharacterized protein F5891DRAFT_1195469 [Suillus fuscotomentosus]|uniref:Uncharacterized protein n=1 Tax=Suillus fuscotomentosus TaxID=1912939 RepID=A0AAD4DUK2_9AGAM|nr:uncharacterized protein F5891DRAFT_1195469 [Suillus fuscotomentosus]KAG1894203.1 hypothetical protein F5891DRAFT_1195469 [Suillus fuscotomentosus]
MQQPASFLAILLLHSDLNFVIYSRTVHHVTVSRNATHSRHLFHQHVKPSRSRKRKKAKPKVVTPSSVERLESPMEQTLDLAGNLDTHATRHKSVSIPLKRLQLPVLLWSISYHSVDLAKIPAWFPGAGFKRIAREWRGSLEEMAFALHEFVKDLMIADIALVSFTSNLLEGSDVSAEEEHVVKWSALSLYAGGGTLTGCDQPPQTLQVFYHPSATALGLVEQDANY